MSEVYSEFLRALRSCSVFSLHAAACGRVRQVGRPFRKAINFANAVEERLSHYYRGLGRLACEPRMQRSAKGAQRNAKRTLGLLMRKTFRSAEYNREADQLVNHMASLAKLDPLGEWGVCVRFELDDNLVRSVTGREHNRYISSSEFLDIDSFDANLEPFWVFCAPRFKDLCPRTYTNDDAKKGLLRLLVARLQPHKQPRGAPPNVEAQNFYDDVSGLLERYCGIRAGKTNVKAMRIFNEIVNAYKLDDVLRPSYRAKAHSELKRRAKLKARGARSK